MSPYQHIFSTNAVLNVWRNLRSSHRDPNDLLLTFQYHPDDVRAGKSRFGKNHAVETSPSSVEEKDASRRQGTDAARGDGRSIGFVVPWRSMQAQKRELREKEKELAEALVVLAGEVAFTDLPDNLQTSLSTNHLIQVRHICAGLSRQISKLELQMADNAPFCRGKNLYTGGEIARRFLPPIQTLFQQEPVPQRMIFELLMELKDMVFAGMVECDREVLEWELENFGTFEELDDILLGAITPIQQEEGIKGRHLLKEEKEQEANSSRKLLRPPKKPPSDPNKCWLSDEEEILYHLESLETTAAAMKHLVIPIDDFCAKSIISLRRMLDRRVLNDFAHAKKRRAGRCAEYARCMKWAGTSWRQGGGCRRGCKNEDEDPEALPSWHSSSRHFAKEGTYMLGGGKGEEKEKTLTSRS